MPDLPNVPPFPNDDEVPTGPASGTDADLVDPEEADLIAYLDGELDEEESRSIAARMALNPEIRERAEAYKKTFDLLDYLPKPELPVDFTTRTLTRLQPLLAGEPGPHALLTASSGSAAAVAVGTSTATQQAQAAAPGFHAAPWLWLLAAILAFSGGYLSHTVLRGNGLNRSIHLNELPLSDLQVIEQLPLYRGVDDLRFLQSLDDPELFATVEHTGEPSPSRSSVTPISEQPAAEREVLIRLFLSYPAARRQQLRELQRQRQALPVEQQRRLAEVLERYAVWLDRLPEAEQAEVLRAENSSARLEVVRRIREKLWREALPTRHREQLKLIADPEEALRLVACWKDAEQSRRDEWLLARRQWGSFAPGSPAKPWPFNDVTLTREIDQYLKTVLKVDLNLKLDSRFEPPSGCRLDRQEYQELKLRHDAAHNEGYWLLYGASILRLAERHPSLPGPANGKPVTDLNQVPKEFLKELRAKNLPDLNRQRGKWPEFALELADAAYKQRLATNFHLGPARPQEFASPVREFFEQQLLPKLSPDSRAELASLEGKWPEYPRRFVELARRHDLSIPGVTLPGPPSLWRKYYAPAAVDSR